MDETAKRLVLTRSTHFIAAHASYHGDLIKDDYQFTFGGSSLSTYKKHDVFNGFLVPERGLIYKFTALDTGFKFNSKKKQDLLNYFVVDLGLDNPIPLFTLVLIRKNKEPIDVGTLHFMYTEYDEIGRDNPKTNMEYVFKRSEHFKDEKEIWVESKDILNIRTEINTTPLSIYKLISNDLNYILSDASTEFFTYHATILIQFFGSSLLDEYEPL